MVDVNMFKDAFNFGSRPKQAGPMPQPGQVQNVQYVPQPVAAPAPAPRPIMSYPQSYPQPQGEDPDVAKFRFMMLKWLSIIVGGAAILLIVWRVILKFI